MTSAPDRPENKPPDDERPADSLLEWIRGRPLPRDSHLVIGLALPMVLLAIGMWRVRAYTVDDAYISFRYARNLANGLGLVFNAGERIEGYTNFLFTCLLALGMKCGVDPERAAKILGAASALGSIALTYAIAARIKPPRRVPVIATWLLAGSLPTAGWAVFGLETSFFVALLLLGTWLFLRERDAPSAFPWSGAALAAAALTRPEAPLFAGLLMIFLAGPKREITEKRSLFAPIVDLLDRKNLIRAALFVAPIAAHLAFRRLYYSAWLPNTFAAKTGDLAAQIEGGRRYLLAYVEHVGPLLAIVPLGVVLAIARRRADLGAIAAIAIAVPIYVLVVGGDWMPAHRFLAPFEPFAFLLVDAAARALLEAFRPIEDRALARARIARARPVRVAARVIVGAPLVAFAIHTATSRSRAFADGAQQIERDRLFWTSAAGGVAAWFAEHGRRGTIAIADMGFVAYATDYPILDLLGLVDPVISKLPGGYTRKDGAGYVERVFDVAPRYFVFVGSRTGCAELPFPSQARLRADRRFWKDHALVAEVRHTLDGYWCIFGPRDEAPR
ncbi:MAG: hypothetical protein U0441_14685 [Polyangiaceae bacterium]